MGAGRARRIDFPEERTRRLPNQGAFGEPETASQISGSRLAAPLRRPLLFLAPLICVLAAVVALSPPGRLALAGVLASLFLGLGLSVGADRLDSTIKSAEQLRSALPFPVLATIRYVEPRDQRRWAARTGVVGDDTAPVGTVKARGARARTLPFRRVAARGSAAR